MLFFHFFFSSGNTPIAVWGTHLDLIQNPQIRAKHGGKEHVNVSMTAELGRGHVKGGDWGWLTALEAEISNLIQKRGHGLLSERSVLEGVLDQRGSCQEGSFSSWSLLSLFLLLAQGYLSSILAHV